MDKFLTDEEMNELLKGMDYNKAMTLDAEVLQVLKAYLEGQENFDRAQYNAISNALLEMTSKEVKEAEAQERKAAQEEMKATFELPRDYNALFDDHRANDEIKLLIDQVIDQMTSHYETVISAKDEENLVAIRELRESYEEKIMSSLHERDAAKKAQEQAEAEAEDLKNAVRDLNDEKQKLAEENTFLKQQLAQAQLEKKDAEAKRDAAMREVESLKAQIVELEQMATKPKPAAGLKFSLTSTIVEDKPIKSSREIALEKFGLLPPKTGGEPSGGTFPDQAETGTTDELGTESNSQIHTDDQVSREDFRNSIPNLEGRQTMVPEATGSTGSTGSDEEVSAAALKARIEAVEARLSIIERHPNIRISA